MAFHRQLFIVCCAALHCCSVRGIQIFFLSSKRLFGMDLYAVSSGILYRYSENVFFWLLTNVSYFSVLSIFFIIGFNLSGLLSCNIVIKLQFPMLPHLPTYNHMPSVTIRGCYLIVRHDSLQYTAFTTRRG